MTIDEAVVAAQAGDQQGFEVLHKHHWNFVFNMCRRLVKDTTLAEDLTQTTFVRAFEKIREFQKNSTFQTWIFRIGYNVCQRYFRDVKYERNLLHNFEHQHRPVLEEFGVSLESIKQKVGPLLFRHCVEGYTDRELAAEAGVTVSCMKNRIKHERQRRIYNPKPRPNQPGFGATLRQRIAEARA